MLRVLDPHSAFLDPRAVPDPERRSEGRYGGVGIEIDVERRLAHGGVRVCRKDRLRARGVKPGDRFLAIDGDRRARPADRAGAGAHARRARHAGAGRAAPARHADQALDLTLTREVIELRAVDARVLPDGIVYVRLKLFQETTADELRRALDEAVEHAARERRRDSGVMLDLRDNPGGLLSSAVRSPTSSSSDGVIVSTRGARRPDVARVTRDACRHAARLADGRADQRLLGERRRDRRGRAARSQARGHRSARAASARAACRT